MKNQPDAVACANSKAPGQALTYGKLNVQANQLAHYLAKTYGIKSGDRVMSRAKTKQKP